MARQDAAERIANSFSALEIPGGLYAGELKALATRIRRELRKAFRDGMSVEGDEQDRPTKQSQAIAARYGVKL